MTGSTRNTLLRLFGFLFVLSTVWLGIEVARVGVADVRPPVFPAMCVGAVVAVVLVERLSRRRTGSGAAAALLAVVIFTVMTASILAAWSALFG